MSNQKNETYSNAAGSASPFANKDIMSYLIRPSDPFFQKFLEKDIVEIQNIKCRYKAAVYGPAVELTPKIIAGDTYRLEETHLYSKQGSNTWYAIKTMQTPSVRSSILKNAFLAPNTMSKMIASEPPDPIPEQQERTAYKDNGMVQLDTFPEYCASRKLDEIQAFCQVFTLDDSLYKGFALCARKNDFSWRLDVGIQTEQPQLSSADFMPPGCFFGSFTPTGFHPLASLFGSLPRGR